ncbi:MAG: helix-turn-helix transcriptional regulator [Clostridia bacterium]|nr:helix-turn-helix transcriptional regulator [Clostridia bacterium]
MEKNEIKQNIAKNIGELRKANKLTQLELAEKLNYSDKAISRWERGDTLPDIDVLCQICELFGVSFEYLISKNTEKEIQKNTLAYVGNRLTITLLAISVVWIIATFVYVYSNIIFETQPWTSFTWAVPATCLVAFCCNKMWGKRIYSLFILSVGIWSLIAAIYLQLLAYNLWLIFLLGLPIQVTIFLWYRLKPKQK